MSARIIPFLPSPALLFVYGTLMQGGSRHHFLGAGRVKSIVAASTAGELYDLGEYPGIKLLGGAPDRVFGQLIELDDLPAILPTLDAEEGPEYCRQVVTVRTSEGREVLAWTYVYTEPTQARTRIVSGRYSDRKA